MSDCNAHVHTHARARALTHYSASQYTRVYHGSRSTGSYMNEPAILYSIYRYLETGKSKYNNNNKKKHPVVINSTEYSMAIFQNG